MRYDATFRPAVVSEITNLTPEIREFTLLPEGGAHGYLSGAHLRVQVVVHQRLETRHYSLIGSPNGTSWKIAVKREDLGKGGSQYLWSLSTGDTIMVSQPDSHFQLAPNVPQYLLIAGGIGITPILGMAEVLARRGQPFTMHYGAQSLATMAYSERVQSICGSAAQLYYQDQGQMIDLEAAFSALHPQGEAYVCGPLGLLNAATATWSKLGRARFNLRFETFGSSGSYAPAPFAIRVNRLNREVMVPADVTMLDALDAEGVKILSDCNKGECGLCAVRIIDSTHPIDHRDVFFSDAQHEANEFICVCVSRVSGGVITIDPPYRGDPDLATKGEPYRVSHHSEPVSKTLGT